MPFKKGNPGCECCDNPSQECEVSGGLKLDDFDATGDWSMQQIPDENIGTGDALFSSSGQLLWKNSWRFFDSTVYIRIGIAAVEFIDRATGNIWYYNTFRYNAITLLVDYTDANNYHKATFDMPANRVRIYVVKNSNESLLLECQMFIDWLEYDFSQYPPDYTSFKVPDGETVSTTHFVSLRVDYTNNLIIASTSTGTPYTGSTYGSGREVAVSRGNIPRGKRAGVNVSAETYIEQIAVGTCADPFAPSADCPLCLHADVNAPTFTSSAITIDLDGMEDYNNGVDIYRFSEFNGTYTVPWMPRSAMGGFGSQIAGCGLCEDEYFYCHWHCGWHLRVDNYPHGDLYLFAIGRDPPVAVAIIKIGNGGFGLSLSKEPEFTDCDSWSMSGNAVKCGDAGSYIQGTPTMSVSSP